jgi:hypothetical protein
MATIVYAGTEHGIATVKDQGNGSWTVESHGLDSWEVPSLATRNDRPNRVIAGTRGDGVWVSEDFGASWRKPSYGKPGPGKVRSVTIDPKNPERLYAGCEPIDVFVSNDLAQTWERLASIWDVPEVPSITYPVAVVEPHVRFIAIDPTAPQTVYAALQVGSIAKTTNGGSTWKLLDKDVDCDVHTIVIDPSNTNNVFVATGGHDSRLGKVKGKALYKSADGGESWSPMANDFMQEYSVPLVMNPANPKVMYSALANGQPGQWRKRDSGPESLMIRTQDGGTTWEGLKKGLPAEGREFPEAMAFDPTNPSRVFAGMRSGQLFASADGGDSWQQIDVNLPHITSLSVVIA